jgi:hypothetical protein
MQHHFPVRRPDQQGHIDGMCGVYAVLNACNDLLDLRGTADTHLFASLCKGVPHLFPQIVYDGAGFDGLLDLLGCAQRIIEREHESLELSFLQKYRKVRFASAPAALKALGADLAALRARKTRAIWIVGLGQPWNHWTCVARVADERVHFRDSYGLTDLGLERFTRTPRQSGNGKKIMLDYHQSMLLTLTKRSA